MKKRVRKYVIVLSVGIAVSIALFSLREYWEYFYGIAASIWAALICWALVDVLQDSNDHKSISSIIDRMIKLRQIKPDGLYGLVDIHKRDRVDQEWIAFAGDARHKLTLSGRTLYRWIDSKEKKTALTRALKRVAKTKDEAPRGHEPIRLVLYSDEGLEIEANRRGEDIELLKEQKRTAQSHIYTIWNGLSKIEKRTVAIYEVSSLQYLYCYNGEQCITGTYLHKYPNKMTLQLVFQCDGNDAERAYTEDFNSILASDAERVNIESWDPRNKNGEKNGQNNETPRQTNARTN